jgi:hypothetical protein
MTSKPNRLSLIAALTLTAAAFSAARADRMPGSKEACESAESKTTEQIDALQPGNPHRVHTIRQTSRHSPTNDEIKAAQAEDPNSVDYPNRKDLRGNDGR